MKLYLNLNKKILLIIFLFLPVSIFSASVNIDASRFTYNSNISLSPKSGSFVEGSTFDVPILLDTKGNNINGIEVRIHFDKDRLSIVQPSNGRSIIGVWVEPPRYDNDRGTASFVGVVPDGIRIDSGLVGTITFKAKKTGRATVSISSDSKVLLHDGLGTSVNLDLGRADYSIVPKAPDGVTVFSMTHPHQTDWYNNNNPTISWEGTEGYDGFSVELDSKPFTVPDNSIDLSENSKSYENLSDGIWYFHIKSKKSGVWGGTSHFLVRIDSAPPADFEPELNYVVANAIMVERTLVSFFTTDNLSGIDYYEVGVIDKNQPPTESPVFVEATSPFQVPISENSNLKVIVRAVDKAGNIRDSSIDVKQPFIIAKFIEDYLVYILLFIILVGLVALVLHYLIGHHIIRYFKKAVSLIKKEEEKKINVPNLTPDVFIHEPDQTKKPDVALENNSDKFDGGTI